MSRLLENQAAELLKETNALSLGGAGLASSGKVAGFTNVAFPIVRRVFAGLIANEIVSVQPMSLPTGLLFYLDYTYGSSVGGDAGTTANQFGVTNVVNPSTYTSQDSVYNNPRGSGIRSGSLATGGQYDLAGHGYSKVHKQARNLLTTADSVGAWAAGSTWTAAGTSPDPLNGSHLMFVVRLANAGTAPAPTGIVGQEVTASAALADALSVNADGSTLTIPSFESNFAVDASPRIPEVDIRIESTAVTAQSRKLRARWSPEMAQDLTAFYSIDVEVELTNILSEMITLDIDREILNDLLTQAGAANLFWSRAPGKIVNKFTGAEALQSSTLSPGPMAFVNIQEWYQTLLETVTDAANTIHRKTLRGSGNFIVTSPDVCTILEHLVAYKPSYRVDADGQVRDNMVVGAEAVGTLNNRYTIYKDPYFPSNKLLVGLKGNTFLESGFIYAPYVPLILTPVIYAQEDFTPEDIKLNCKTKKYAA